MRKTVILIIISLFIVSIGGYFAYAKFTGVKKPTKPSEYQLGISMESALKTPDRPILAMFYADWCTYCMRFMPTMQKLSEQYRDKYNFVMIDAEDSANVDLVKDYRIGGFPTLYIIDPQIDNRISIPISSYQSIDFMKEDLDRYLRVKKLTNCEMPAEN